jgi:aminopeptidase N
VWGSLWDSTRDAEIPPSEFVELVLGNIGQETESTTVRTALGQLSLVVRNYVAPERRKSALEDAADRIWALAKAAEAGSDSQFQLVKAFASLASTAEHARTLSALRDNTLSLDGLTIDTDLSWELLAGLALAGAATSADIDQALEADNTSNGQQAAARARALLPTRADKQAVFDQLVDSDETPNAIVRALTLGFDVANDPSVMEPFIERYFSVIEALWATRTYKIAEYLAEGLYPGSVVSEELVTATKSWLAKDGLPPALRRIVEENLAGVERALRVQAKDRETPSF